MQSTRTQLAPLKTARAHAHVSLYNTTSRVTEETKPILEFQRHFANVNKEAIYGKPRRQYYTKNNCNFDTAVLLDTKRSQIYDTVNNL